MIFFLSLNISISYSQEKPDQEGKVVIRAAGKRYNAGPSRRFFLGTHYRKEWTTPVRVKVFEIDTIKGGLTPIKQGGRQQTLNLRLEDSLGRQYVLRSVDKEPTKALPEDLKKTAVGKISQDMESAENPYGSLIIPILSKAAGILYTTPQLYYVPFDSSFGEYASVFANKLFYFEERPDGDMSHNAGSGFSKKVIGTDKMFDKIYKNNDHQVDTRLYARSRLFDMIIGDWGRHEDQWRWASFKTEKGGVIYKPIPRDRDHVFYKAEGIIPWLSNRKWAVRKNQNFEYKIKDLIGLNMSAKSIDRALLSKLSKQDWIEIADSLKAAITDEVIDIAVREMPENIYPLHGEEIAEKLKSRRDRITKYAVEYYDLISKDVDVTGTDDNEVFIVKRINKSTADVIVINSKKDTIYHRVFNKKDTKEIRLYGIDGDDEFLVEEGKNSRPQIRIIHDGGFVNEFDSAFYYTFFNQYTYTAGSLGNQLMTNTKIIYLRSDVGKKNVNAYDRYDYNYNLTAFKPSFQYNPDDGVFLGLGVLRKTFGYHKYPYESYQTAGFNYAFKTGAVVFNYFGDFKKVFNEWNTSLDILAFGPKFALNYFGLGNETVYDQPIKFYRVKATYFRIHPLLYRNISKRVLIGLGPQFQYIKIDSTPGRFIATPEANTKPTNFESNYYLGFKFFGQFNTLDNIIFPKKGVRLNVQTLFVAELNRNDRFITITPDFSFFITPKFAKFITFASRTGGATNIGKFSFYQGNILGGTTNLRGYRRTRFDGRTSFYQNFDARIKIADVNLYLFPAKIGLILFYDIGRVWQDNEKSNVWHPGFGPGLYLQLRNRLALTGTYGFGKGSTYFNFELGFLF